VRWRRDLRAACFWLALALGTAALAHEVGALYYAASIPPVGLALRALMNAFGTRTAGRLAERVADRLTTALGPEYVVLTEYPPVRMSETPAQIRAHAPLLGEHTEQVLHDVLGMDDTEIAQLTEEGVLR